MTLKLKLYGILMCCAFTTVHAQIENQFNKVDSFYINGDAIITGNNILSEDDTKELNDFSLLNDQIRMKYVDIDASSKTFSSSSATVAIQDSSATLVKATLYWAGIFPFLKGTKKEKPNEIFYYGSGDRKGPIESVLLKTPGNNEYQTVNGTILFDGLDKEGYEDSAPYFCFADVTELLKKSQHLNGEYTVANIKATQGFVSGGGAAGWFLFIIYEAAGARPKYISSFNGYAPVNDNVVDIELTDFKTREEGNIKASIFAAALEGDAKLYQDQLAIMKSGDSSFVALKNKLRPGKNFFSGKISLNDDYIMNRKPASLNSLGFDVLKADVPDDVFSNSQTSTTLRFSTKADRFYAFFSAVSIEISEIFQLNKEALTGDVILAETNNETAQEDNEVSAESQMVEEKALISEPESPEPAKPRSVRETEKRMRTVNMTIPDQEPGYYIITNVFSKPSYAERWEDFLKEKGHEPGNFVNPKNNWRYVYVNESIDLELIYKSYLKLVKLDYFNEIWVFKVNMN